MNLPHFKAPYLNDKQIEREVNYLLTSYGSSVDKIYEPPVPVEDIIEQYLRLNFEILHFAETNDFDFGNVDRSEVMGFYDVNTDTIAVNAAFDPAENPEANEGRFNFTLAHEVGHAVLHKELMQAYFAQPAMEGIDITKQPQLMCREYTDNQEDHNKTQRPWVEKQADTFASYLLMPQHLVGKAWEKITGSDRPLDHMHFVCQMGCFEMNDALTPLAETFKVSKTAMRIRLEKMGKLHNGMQGDLPF